ncbi:MAG: GreA/GreB family elongation factor [Clostridia bacterium]|nr:GreA/GreB family elongation factor [Clostridia bacterium]
MKDELTAVDIKKMKEEIEYRQAVLTPKFKDEVARTRALGDLSENDEYRSAKRELNRNYSRIRYLKAMIETAVVIEVEESDDETVGLFDHITIWYEDDEEERTITIVTTLRNDVLNGLISKESPLGKALLGRRVGERVKIDVNENYSYYVEIRSLEKGADDASLNIN